MVVREGYKQTEAGAVPIDWHTHTVGDMIDFQGGAQPDKSVFSPSKKKGYIRLIQIRDYKTDKFETYIPSVLARRFCDEDDIMIGRYGPPVFQILKGINGAYNVALIKAIPHAEIDKNYAYYYLKQEKLFSFIDKLSRRTSGQTGVDLKELRAYPLSLPATKIEQKAIAKALSDVDALIASLEQLITKKQLIKKGAMQELLTGKRRLSGFEVKQGYKQTEIGEIPEDWRLSKIKDIASVFSGGTPNTSNSSFYGDEIPFIASGELNQKRIKTTNKKITVLGLENSSAKQVNKGTFLIAMYGATAGVSAITEIDGAINQAVLAIIPDNVNISYLFNWFQLNKENIITVYTQGGQPNLSGNIIKKIEIPIPPPLEQEAISTILSDMDTELEALKTKLVKTKQIKEGMMHELLTGGIRLI